MNDEWLIRAKDLHRRALVIDTHCDTTSRLMKEDWDFGRRHEDGHVDIPRLREGGVDAVFFAVFAPAPIEPGAGVSVVRAQTDRIRRTVERYAEGVAPARTAADVRRAAAEGRLSVLIAVEGGHLIEDSLDALREYYELGATYLTLTHASHTNWADSSGVHEAVVARHGGLTAFGRDVVRELNRLGMMVDVSHVSDETFWDVMETAAAPVVATHSSCRAVSPHRRNLTDEMMRAVAESGGVVQINFAAAFVDPDFPRVDFRAVRECVAAGGAPDDLLGGHVTPLSRLADHFDHAIRLIGPAHVGIGSDFDGVPVLPDGMADCSKLPHLTAELLRRGHTEADLVQVLGENVLRVMDACRRRAAVVREADGATTDTDDRI